MPDLLSHTSTMTTGCIQASSAFMLRVNCSAHIAHCSQRKPRGTLRLGLRKRAPPAVIGRGLGVEVKREFYTELVLLKPLFELKGNVVALSQGYIKIRKVESLISSSTTKQNQK